MRVCLVFCVMCVMSSAMADTIYRYTDPVTKREVFVNHLEQVPAAIRDTARPIDADQVELATGQGEPSMGGVSLRWKDVPISVGDLKKTVEVAFASGSPGSPIQVASRTLVAGMDLKLKATGRQGLYPSEVLAFTRWFGVLLVLLVLAWVVALIAWVIFLFHAVRSRRFIWLVGLILVYPLSYLYALLCVEKGRWKLRYLGLLCLVAPALISLVVLWRFSAWYQAVLAARAGLV